MNRRDFLHKGSAAAIVAAGLPKPARYQNTISIYRTSLLPGLPGQWYYEIGLYHTAVQNFGTAVAAQKIMGLKVHYYNTTDQTKPLHTGEYKYNIIGTELINKAGNIWKIKTSLDKKVSGDHQFSNNYPSNLGFQCKPSSYVNILDKNDLAQASAAYTTVSSSSLYDDGEDCFLTTACVKHKGLQDDCKELETLRWLRDQYMSRNREGQILIRQYRTIGPDIVMAINSCCNKTEIYEYMYRYMIIPSMDLVKQGRYEEAKTLYKTYVKALKKAYC